MIQAGMFGLFLAVAPAPVKAMSAESFVAKYEGIMTTEVDQYEVSSGDCKDIYWARAIGTIDGVISSKDKLKKHSYLQAELLTFTASTLNRLADEMAKKGCLDLARETYMEVIDTFIGSHFVALRQHAQIGIEALGR